MMIRKYLFMLIIVGFFLCGGRSFAFFENKMYCQLSKDNIVISLSGSKVPLCNAYVLYIEGSMKKIYKDILSIQKYIDKKEDVGYWQSVKDDKNKLLSILQQTRLKILSHMQIFEKTMFSKSKTYFLDGTVEYQRRLKRSLKVMQTLNEVKAKVVASYIQAQLNTIENIANAQTFEELNTLMQNYVYFKQKIEGK